MGGDRDSVIMTELRLKSQHESGGQGFHTGNAALANVAEPASVSKHDGRRALLQGRKSGDGNFWRQLPNKTSAMFTIIPPEPTANLKAWARRHQVSDALLLIPLERK